MAVRAARIAFRQLCSESAFRHAELYESRNVSELASTHMVGIYRPNVAVSTIDTAACLPCIDDPREASSGFPQIVQPKPLSTRLLPGLRLRPIGRICPATCVSTLCCSLARLGLAHRRFAGATA